MVLFQYNQLGAGLAAKTPMSSYDKTHQNMVPGLQPETLANSYHKPPPAEPRQISLEVAHDLNNVLTIIQAYAERMLSKHRDNPALRPELQLIFDNARRATSVVRQASVRNSSTAPLLG